jgi:hypothetical protein
MRKTALLVLFLMTLVPAAGAAPEKWYEAYERGVTAVNAKNYKAAAEALGKAVAETPNEGLNVRTRKELITYVPHFWLGIAKFNLGDPDGALREWRICEEQGVLAKTEYYARMKDWVARAQSEKQRNAQTAASGSRKAADTAISRALSMQLDALSAGGDRTESYNAAQRKLREARTQFEKAGTDVQAYSAAEKTAAQAASLFGSAADEGKKLKAARATAPPPVRKPAAQVPAQHAQVVIATPPAKIETPIAEPVKTVPVAEPQVLSEAEVTRRIEEQEAKRRKPTAEPALMSAPIAPAASVAADLRPAFRAFAAGDFTTSERLLNGILRNQAAAEAYLLRGCMRYTRAMLSRKPDSDLMAAREDFRAALEQNRRLRLDRNTFSPKLVAYFEQVRQQLR